MPGATAILLCTLNASWQHAAFGLRYLLANLGRLRDRAAISEFTINQKPLDIVEAILAKAPQIVGFGVYIWNVAETTEVISILRQLRPQLKIVLGGPEVSHEVEAQEIVNLADVVITGEADLTFSEVCGLMLSGENLSKKIIPGRLPPLKELTFPYHLYSDTDLQDRFVYVEASRGCPFSCEFCLSSLDIPVRAFPLEPLLGELGKLLHRGATHLKFVDRTFNLSVSMSRAILEFFARNWRPGLFLHFEMIPDRLPDPLREIIATFPSGAVQFEVGVQTFSPAVAENISRRNDLTKLKDNLRFLRERTNVHVHADLIAGLPGETLTSFAEGFDRLVAMRPQEIQVGILKRLRGTPIVRHDAACRMRYSPHPPYEVLETADMSFGDLQHLRRFAKFWDLINNRGHFRDTVALLWSVPEASSPFAAVSALTDFLWQHFGRTDGIPLLAAAKALFDFLTTIKNLEPSPIADAMWSDLTRSSSAPRRAPDFLARHLSGPIAVGPSRTKSAAPSASRQRKHAGES